MPATVGAGPGRYYAGVVVSVVAPQVIVAVSDEPDEDGDTVEIFATGTAALNDKVTVLIQPTGRAILIRS